MKPALGFAVGTGNGDQPLQDLGFQESLVHNLLGVVWESVWGGWVQDTGCAIDNPQGWSELLGSGRWHPMISADFFQLSEAGQQVQGREGACPVVVTGRALAGGASQEAQEMGKRVLFPMRLGHPSPGAPLSCMAPAAQFGQHQYRPGLALVNINCAAHGHHPSRAGWFNSGSSGWRMGWDRVQWRGWPCF